MKTTPISQPPTPARPRDPSTASRMATWATGAGLLAALQLVSPQAQAQLHLRLQAGGITESQLASNVVLHVPSGGTPSPFLPAGPFTAEWSGGLNLDLRADFQFQAHYAGKISLQINGTNLFDPPSSTHLTTTDWSRPVRLKKGTNSFRLLLSRTQDSEATLRLDWRGRTTPPSPIPTQAWTPETDLHPGDNPTSAAAHRGRDLFLVHRCSKCHSPEVDTPVPDLAADAPSFVGIGSRRNPVWLSRWILDPRALQATATMPRVLHGPAARAGADDIAAWLQSLEAPVPSLPRDFRPVPAIGRSLVETLLCRSCHTLGDEADAPGKVTLRFVPEKFIRLAHVTEYLKSPERHDTWSRMPNFRLSDEEAGHIASFLLAGAAAQSVEPNKPDPARVRRGLALAKEAGCFQCHGMPGEPSIGTATSMGPAVRALANPNVGAGCLSEPGGDEATGEAARRFPSYRFSTGDRADLVAFLKSGSASLGRHVPADFAQRWTRELRCGACHGSVEGLPRLEGAGEKLRPEWFRQFLAGETAYKPRPWLPSRMPSFPAFAQGLAEGYAALHGLPPRSQTQPPQDPEAASIGRKMVSASAGFACVTCHAIGGFSGAAIFEAPGVNLAYAVDRLRQDYFVRWVRNPQAFDPATKMPLYFDEAGNSALSDYFGGDGPKTLHALWEYLKAGSQITPPEP